MHRDTSRYNNNKDCSDLCGRSIALSSWLSILNTVLLTVSTYSLFDQLENLNLKRRKPVFHWHQSQRQLTQKECRGMFEAKSPGKQHNRKEVWFQREEHMWVQKGMGPGVVKVSFVGSQYPSHIQAISFYLKSGENMEIIIRDICFSLNSSVLDNDPRKRGIYLNITCCQFQLFPAAISYDVFFFVSLAVIVGSASQPGDTDSPSHPSHS